MQAWRFIGEYVLNISYGKKADELIDIGGIKLNYQKLRKVISKVGDSGFSGISIITSETDNGLELFWNCSIASAAPGKRGEFRNISYSFIKYGYRGAYIRAVKQKADSLNVQIEAKKLLHPYPRQIVKKLKERYKKDYGKISCVSIQEIHDAVDKNRSWLAPELSHAS